MIDQPRILIGSLVVTDFGATTGYTLDGDASLPEPAKRAAVADALEAQGTPPEGWYELAVRTFPLQVKGADEAACRTARSALLRAMAPLAVLSLQDASGGEVRTCAIRHGDLISDTYRRVGRRAGLIHVSAVIVTDPYWLGPSVTVTGGALTYATPYRNLAVTLAGDVDSYLAVSLSGLVVGQTYTLTRGTASYGKVTFKATATTATIEGRNYTGMEPPAIYAPVMAYDGTHSVRLDGIANGNGTVTLAATYKPRYLSA